MAKTRDRQNGTPDPLGSIPTEPSALQPRSTNLSKLVAELGWAQRPPVAGILSRLGLIAEAGPDSD